MKIWLNHKLACPDDASYPLRLTIFTWESQEISFQSLIDGYRARILYNYRNEDSPLSIEIQDSQEEAMMQNTHQLQEESSIIHQIIKGDQKLFCDTCVITPVPLEEYLLYYLDVLEEFKYFTDRSTSSLALELYKLVTSTIQPVVQTVYQTMENHRVHEVEEVFMPILQELLLLNIFLTYLEIEEGLLVCPHCKRWFPIIKTIPRLYPKTMKREEMDLAFVKKWRALCPDDVIVD